MKPISALLLAAAIATLSGCASAPSASAVDGILSRTLPPTFAGDVSISHRNAYVDFKIKAKNLRQENGAWRWESLEYERNGRFSSGVISLGKQP